MRRLLVHVEGETEEDFVNQSLAPHLYTFGYQKISARLLGNSRNRSKRGGIRSWSTVRKEILSHLKDDAGCLATTMVDYYALPKEGADGWPGRSAAGALPFSGKASTLQTALHADICHEMGDRFNQDRFIPYVMMHEFEGLLFSDCRSFAKGIGRPELENRFQAIRNDFATPEEINDSPLTAPSKRVADLVPGYQKPYLGGLAILEIGLETIREECPLFGAWLRQLEQGCSLAAGGGTI